jgi:hypothetical protein
MKKSKHKGMSILEASGFFNEMDQSKKLYKQEELSIQEWFTEKVG